LKLINDVLDISRVEAGRLELSQDEFDAVLAVDGAIKLVEVQAETAGVKLERLVQARLPRLVADLRRVQQMLINLLANAVKFTPPGGRVLLRVRYRADGNDRKAGWMEFSVFDTGIGIPEEKIATALAVFGQVDSEIAREKEGAGLGLPLTKALAEMHGGSLELKSRLGHGTAVTIRLPVRPTGKEKPAPLARAG
jgi:signal transduction histidine kinase